MWSLNKCKEIKEFIDEDDYSQAYEVLQTITKEEIESKEILLFYLACSCYHLRKIDEAISCYDKLLQLKPNLPQAHYGLAGCYGIRHNLPECYKHFEHRFKMCPIFATFHQRFPNWDGKSTGKSIFVYHEQGLGDMIQLLRFLPKLREFFSEIVIEAPYPLNGLLTEQHCDMILMRGNMPIDHHAEVAVSLGSLPYFLGTDKDNIPPCPYLFPREHVAVREISVESPRRKIGVCWFGGRDYIYDKYRSSKLHTFLPLRELGEVYNLSLSPSPFVNFGFKNFQEVANVISQLDVVVTVDTAVAHLAGAIGKKTYLLLGKYADFRWGLEDLDTYWYPSFKILRGDYSDSISRCLDRQLED